MKTQIGEQMKNQIFGRKVGSGDDMVLLFSSEGVSTSGKTIDPAKIIEFALESAHRRVQMLRERNVEGYVLFEGDPTCYEFTPSADFVYPASTQ
jgi:hypothetical protein